MIHFTYDKTFEGFLSLVSDSYELNLKPERITAPDNYQAEFFCDTFDVATDKEKSDELWKRLHEKLSENACRMLSTVFLSELPGIELLLYQFIDKALNSPQNIESNFAEPCVMEVSNIFKKVAREAQRTSMFVRFQKTADEVFYASFDPKYNVLPLTIHHFKNRFADQKWVIFDTRRKYGYFYDLDKVAEITFASSHINAVNGNIDDEIRAEDDLQFRELWKNYFTSLTIKERINRKLHLQHLPKRFWKYLPEKQPF